MGGLIRRALLFGVYILGPLSIGTNCELDSHSQLHSDSELGTKDQNPFLVLFLMHVLS